MTETEQYLFEEFKRLDAICCDMFLCQHGVSEYINQMEMTSPYLKCQIPAWDEDYRSLKHLRWLRNQIAHESSAPECGIEDIEQLENFYNRVLHQQDPLAVAGKLQRESRRTAPQKRHPDQRIIPHSDVRSQKSPPLYRERRSILRVGVVILLMIASFLAGYFLKS